MGHAKNHVDGAQKERGCSQILPVGRVMVNVSLTCHDVDVEFADSRWILRHPSIISRTATSG
jgi:hypothetical protein